jgi:hypothetical protein
MELESGLNRHWPTSKINAQMDTGTSRRNYLRKLYAFLPPPLNITDPQFNEYFEWMIATLESALSSRDLDTIHELVRIARDLNPDGLLELSPHLAKRLIVVLYSAATTWPIVSYSTQIKCCLTVGEVIEDFETLQDLRLPWQPFIRFVRHILFDAEDVLALVEDSDTEDPFFTAMYHISDYFPESATTFLLDLCLPKISPRGGRTVTYMTLLGRLIPPMRSSYKSWFPQLFRDQTQNIATTEGLSALLFLTSRILRANLSDDFHFVLRPVMNLFNHIIINDMPPSYLSPESDVPLYFQINSTTALASAFARVICWLFLSPPTRQETIGRFASTLHYAKQLVHPSAGELSPTLLSFFFSYLVATLTDDVKLSDPTPEELHLFLKPVVDCFFRMMPTQDPESPYSQMADVCGICALDPSATLRFAEFAFECVSLTDVKGVAQQAWVVMTAVFVDLPKQPFEADLFVQIFNAALDSFFMTELQTTLNEFFTVVFSMCPFDPEKCPAFLQGVDFCELAVRFFTAHVEAARSFPALQDRFAPLDPVLLSRAGMAVIALLAGASQAVVAELFPVMDGILSDPTCGHTHPYFARFLSRYLLRCDSKSRKALKETVKNQLLRGGDTVWTSCCLYR